MGINFAHRLTDDTELRLLEPRHAEEAHALINQNRQHLSRWLSWVARRQSVEDTREYIRQCLLRFAEDRSPYCGIWHDGKLVGTIDLMGISSHSRCGEIGYWLDEAYQGRGLITNACRVLVSHAFSMLGANRIEIRAEPANTRSRAVAERLGFCEEGTLRQVVNMGNHFVDRVVYAMLREEWDGEDAPITFECPLSADSALRVMEPRYAGERTASIEANYMHLSRWLGWVDQYTTVEANEQYGKSALEQYAKETGVITGIWYHGCYAGSMALLHINRSVGSAEIGYWLGEAFQGQGLATNACRTMICHAFDAVGLNRLQINVQPGNIRSRAIPQRLGFQYEGTTRQAEIVNGYRVDLEVYGLLHSEWKG